MMRSTICSATQSASAEEGAGDDDEAEDDQGRLADLTAVRPLHALELGPAGAQEVQEAAAAAAVGVLARVRRAARGSARRPAAAPVVASTVVAAVADRRAARRRPGRTRARRRRRRPAPPRTRRRRRCAPPSPGRSRGAARRAQASAPLPSSRLDGVRFAALLALLRSLSVAGHGPRAPTGSPGGSCADGTTCRTCAGRCDQGCCAWTYWSCSCAACTPRKRG